MSLINDNHITSNWETTALTNEEIFSPVHIDFVDIFFNSTSDVISLSSTSVNDTSGGTGARTILLVFENEIGEKSQEILTLNGNNKVTSTVAGFRLVCAEVLTTGNLLKNDGDIYLYDKNQIPAGTGIPPTNIINIIPIGYNTLSMMKIFLSKSNSLWNFEYGNFVINSSTSVETLIRIHTRTTTDGSNGLWILRSCISFDDMFENAVSLNLSKLKFDSTVNSGSAYDMVLTLEKTGVAGNASFSTSVGYSEKKLYSI